MEFYSKKVNSSLNSTQLIDPHPSFLKTLFRSIHRGNKSSCSPLQLNPSLSSNATSVFASISKPVCLEPGKPTLIATGVKVAVPPGLSIFVQPNMQLALDHAITSLSIPTFSGRGKGELEIALINHGDQCFIVEPKACIAKITLVPTTRAQFIKPDVCEKLHPQTNHFARIKRRANFNVRDYLSLNCVQFLDKVNQADVINHLTECLFNDGKLVESGLFQQKIRERELQGSTAIGDGIAIPHTRDKAFDHFFLAIAIIKDDILRWDDQSDFIHFVFLIGGPEDKSQEYLDLLSHLTTAVKSVSEREALLQCTTAEGVVKHLMRF